MLMTREEYAKDLKDKELDVKFKTVRNAHKLLLSKFMLDAENQDYEKLIESFIGLDPSSAHKKKKSFLDDLLEIGIVMDEVFADITTKEELQIVQALKSTGLVYMDKMAAACLAAKTEHFPRFKEKFDMGLSEEQEAKTVVPKAIFYSVKLYLDKYYLLFRLFSVNVKARAVFVKLGRFRQSLIAFEYNIAYYLSVFKKDYIKEVILFKQEMKITLMRLRKLFEAIDDSSFGKLVKMLYTISIENGVKTYIKYNPEVVIDKPLIGLVAKISLADVLGNYERNMFPVRQVVAENNAVFQSKLSKEVAQKAFWDFVDKIHSFRDGMYKVSEDIGNGVLSSDSDYKYFIQIIQSLILPYVSQSKGEVNDTFFIGVKNLDIFFWKLIVKMIENAQEKSESMDEILGLVIKVSEKEIKEAYEALKASKESSEQNLPEKNE